MLPFFPSYICIIIVIIFNSFQIIIKTSSIIESNYTGTTYNPFIFFDINIKSICTTYLNDI